MNYFDPGRPQVLNRPAYLTHGKPVAPLPYIAIMPKDDDSLQLSTWLLAGPGSNAAGYYWATIKREDLEGFFRQWVEDPEACLKARFSWQPETAAEGRPQAKAKANLTLDDLGL